MADLPALPPLQPGIEISASSRGMSQGIAQTRGVQLFARGFIRIGAAQLGVQWKNIDSPSANGVGALFGKLRWNTGKFQMDAGAAYRIRTGATANVGAWEFSAGASRKFGGVTLRAYAEYSPDEFGKRTSLYVEAGPRWDIDNKWRASAAIGRRDRHGAPDYKSFNAGISRAVGRHVAIDARLFTSDRHELGENYKGRLVLSVRFVADPLKK